jgi:hypothetical protein
MKTNLNLPKDQTFCDGVLNVVFPSLKSYVKAIHDNGNFKGWLFRGQYSSSWELQSSLQRVLPKGEVSFGTKHLEKFKIYARGILNYDHFSQANDEEIWAIGQHQGLKTPLLDWTASPFVALFFAFEEENIATKLKDFPLDPKILAYLKKIKKAPKDFRAVYFLNAKKAKQIFYKLVGDAYLTNNPDFKKDLSLKSAAKGMSVDPSEYMGLMIERALLGKYETKEIFNYKQAYKNGEMLFFKIVSPGSGESKRLLSQRGIFTKTYSPSSIDKIVKDGYKEENLLVKAFIPDGLRDEIISFLDSANINHLSLFPDLYGAARYSNLKIDSVNKAGPDDVMDEIIRTFL